MPHYKVVGYAPQSTSVLGALTANAAPLFNGNIAAMAVNIPKLGASKVYNYHYDQLNRIVAMDAFDGLTPATGAFTPVNTQLEYRERICYDPNGNILTYNRHGNLARLSMDSLSYFYKANTNQLDKVADLAADASPADYYKYNDIRQEQADNNYRYDAIGNLVGDAKDSITGITWTVYGKIASITRAGRVIRYIYDASGNRIMKQTNTDTTVYVRDASGNVMSVYSKPAAGVLSQVECHLYGSSRLGITTGKLQQDTTVLSGGFGDAISTIFIRGEKLFELSNHLGNVLVTVSDKKMGHDAGNGTIDYYTADVVTANDYYPFGSLMPGRKFSANSLYRYGFNGKENDNDVKGECNQQDYGMRIYDPRLGRFLSVDPLTRDYSMLAPYQFASNTPIQALDLDGEEALIKIKTIDANGKVHLNVFKASDHSHQAWQAIKSGMFWAYSVKEAKGITWVSGFDNYNHQELKHGNGSGFVGPNAGTLVVDETDRTNVKVTFELPKKGVRQQGPKEATLSESIAMGWKGFKTLFIKPDPLVEGSEKFKETFDNFLTGVSLALGAGALDAGAATSFWIKAGVANDIDDLLQFSDNAIGDENIKTVISLWKTVTGIKNVTIGGTEMLMEGATPKKVAEALLDLKDVIDGMLKAKELQDQRKEKEAPEKQQTTGG